ncbi:MAG: VWA domain-containing protein [Bacteroidota bacterium]
MIPSTSSSDNLKQAYERFVEFGQLLDRPGRRYLVDYFQAKLVGSDVLVPEELQSDYARYFRKALDQILEIETLLPLLQEHQRINEKVVLDSLQWLRKTYAKVSTKHPHTAEVDRLQGWAVTPLAAFSARYPFLLQFLGSTYEREVLDLGFYRQGFQKYFAADPADLQEADQKRFELLLTDLLAQWDALLQAKILSYQLQKLQEEQDTYVELLSNKVQEFRQLQEIISPFTDYLGWDMSRELWQSASFDILQEYDQLLEDEESIRELADLLGQLREAEIELEEETYEQTIVRQEWVVDREAKAEIVGVHESQDLNYLLSSEVGLLSEQDTEAVFLQRFVDSKLLTFRFEDRHLQSSENKTMAVNQRVKQREKGPFIICVDTSESMRGRPEMIAKVLCLAILKMAIQTNRRAYLINFSVGIKTIDLYDVANSLDEIAKFLGMSFYGGTDPSLALYEAIRQLKGNNYQDADVLMVSDFIMYRIDKDILGEVRYYQQNQGTQFHSLSLSDEAVSELLAVFDTNWQYLVEEKGVVRELRRDLEGEVL